MLGQNLRKYRPLFTVQLCKAYYYFMVRNCLTIGMEQMEFKKNNNSYFLKYIF